MSISSEAESALHDRVAEHVLREAQRDVDALYDFIDPAIRQSRNAKFGFEPEHTLGQIREYTSAIDSAELISIVIDGCTDDGGVDRGNVPTAIVLVTVRYNGCEKPSGFRSPWVMRAGQWYTRATGKVRFSPAT